MHSEHSLTITIKPKWYRRREYGIRFDMLAFFRMLEEFGIGLGDDLSQIGKIPFDDMLATAIYTGGESYCFHTGKRKWFTKGDVLRWVDDSVITRGQMKEIGALWTEFMADYNTDAKGQKKTPKQ